LASKANPSGAFVGTTDTQTLTSKTLTSPVIDTGVSGTAILDEDNMASNSDTKLATQQSIKAYADTKITKAPNITSIDDTGIADGEVAIFDLTNKKIKTSDKTLPTGAIVGTTDTQTLTNKTIDGVNNTLKNISINAPQGFLINGKILPTVSANNLTVAIKGLDGNNPSSTNPVYCRIGDTIRSITSALSVTCSAGTNWFNAGSSELATKAIDYFVYLGYNATDGVVIGFSRIPYAREYSNFSATSTNELYCAISTITNATSGDDYENIGRFRATLSAGVGYTWSVPTFDTTNLIQRPIYETSWLNWQPTYGAEGTMTYTSVTTDLAKYRLKGNEIEVCVYFYGTTGGTASNAFYGTLPITTAGNNYQATLIRDGGLSSANTLGVTNMNGGQIRVHKRDYTSWGLGTMRLVYGRGFSATISIDI